MVRRGDGRLACALCQQVGCKRNEHCASHQHNEGLIIQVGALCGLDATCARRWQWGGLPCNRQPRNRIAFRGSGLRHCGRGKQAERNVDRQSFALP